MKCRTKVERERRAAIAHPPRKVSTLISRRQQAGNQQRANSWNQILPSFPSFFSSFLFGAECLKPVKWAVSLSFLFPLLWFADFLALSLSLLLALQAELGCRGCSSLMASSFSQRFFLGYRTCGCRKF